ncbi:hypothetical protein HDU79_002182 [Rhizoclosmatium sp. JEL0117]|nr:hypothetical protein HDU79_002182 [Rhizoclosmatium sp. JEL0117]
MDINDGCLSTLTSTTLTKLRYTNTSSECGSAIPATRLQRYLDLDEFEDLWAIRTNVLDASAYLFNISLGNPFSNFGRRDANDASFLYRAVNLNTAATTTLATTAFPTSTVLSTIVSTGASVGSVSTTLSSIETVQPTFAISQVSLTSTVDKSSNAAVSSISAATARTTAPTVYEAPATTNSTVAYNGNGKPAGDNIYKGSAVEIIGTFAAIVFAFIHAF